MEMDLEIQFSEKCQITTNDNCSQHNKALLIEFSDGTRVLRGKCTSHHENGTYYIGTDLQSGDFYIVKEFVLPLLTDQEISELLCDIQASVDLKNDNLAAIKNVKHEILDDKCIFYILQEFDFNAIYLSQLLTTNISLPIKILKEIIRNIFILRKFLNSNNFSYLDFKSSAIYIKENGDLKFINYGKTARLFRSDFENYSEVELKVTNAQMYNLGLLLSSLFTAESFSSGREVLSDNTLPFKIQEFLNLYSEETLENLSLGKFFHQSFDVSPNEECLENDPDKSGAINTLERSQSRVEDDFEMQELLGKGGFGKVYKVLKKCDGQTYALKKIVLKPNNKELYDKMIREVTILSQLNHEYIVRYYTSWTESEYIEETDSESSESIYDENSSLSEDKCTFEDDSFCNMNNCAEESSTHSRSKQSQSDSKEDESIIFQRQTRSSIENDNLPTIPTRREILYIQMEFCENKTLKSLIDSDVLLSIFLPVYPPCDISILKYLRQIVEGLVYIHQQNIIHRDLKPTNIFLTSNDHIKIGDFGLATKHIHYKSINIESAKAQPENSTSKNDSRSLTSQVGTGIYIAPELNTCARVCDQKLDMYSLGIILFEMCYKKPPTVQEWNNIITKLRSSDVIFPEDFKNWRFSKEKVIIKLLLTHDVSKRPTSKELLKRDDLPPIVKSQDEERQQELFKYVIDNPHLKLFKNLMDCCFNKENKNFTSVSYRNVKNFHVVNNAIVEVFKTHGAQNISRSTLIPTKCCKGDCHGCTKLMNRLGGFHYIPGNNNIPFINYVALNDSIKWIKCYSLDKKIKNPFNATDESYEYNFNIVTSIDFGKSLSFLPDAEILVIITKIKNLLFNSQSDSFQILISHTLLVEAIYIECNIINSTNYNEIVSPFSSNSRRTIHAAYFSDTCNTEIMNKLPSKINSVESAKSILQHFKVPEAQCKAKQALEELSCILRTAKRLGLKNHDVIIAPKLCKTLTLYSGMIFEYVNVTKQKSLGVGGRYDKLIKHFQDTEEFPQKHTFKYGIGMSLNIETLGELRQVKEEIIVVCTFNQKGILSNEVKILRDLWNANFVCTYFKAKSMKHLKSYCRNNSASYAIVLSCKKIKKNLIEIIDFKDKERKIDVPTDSVIAFFKIQSVLK